jgi:lipopolysaccharide export system permease protein
MSLFQRYLFGAVLASMIAIVGGLVMVALLSQGLSSISLLVENRQSALTYLWVTLLATPQVIALLLPIGLFIAAVTSLNRIHSDSEIVVAQASGMSIWGVAAPIMRLATLAALLHLIINLWIQPTAYREMRDVIGDVRADIVSSLLQSGAFTTPADGLTVYTRSVDATGRLNGLLIHDDRIKDSEQTYVAQTGTITDVDGGPAIIMFNGQIQQVDADSGLAVLDFDQYVFDLSPFIQDDSDLILKASDRYLHELFSPDLTNYFNFQNRDAFIAEGHARLSSPLLNLTLAMIAVLAVVGGDFSRRGYGRRIAFASAAAVIVRLLALGIQSAAEDDPALNIAQYLLPILVLLWTCYLAGRPTGLPFGKKRRFAKRQNSITPVGA